MIDDAELMVKEGQLTQCKIRKATKDPAMLPSLVFSRQMLMASQRGEPPVIRLWLPLLSLRPVSKTLPHLLTNDNFGHFFPPMFLGLFPRVKT